MQRYGLLGFPLSHSFSAQFFAEKFAREGIDARYDNFELEHVDGLRELVATDPELCGLNVTIPHKQAVMKQLDALTPAAAEIGAVNVVRIARLPHGAVCLVGDNSDMVGFAESLRPLLRSHHRKALVLGTGGASKAVVVALRRMGIAPTYVSRRAVAEGVEVGGQPVPTLSYEDVTAELLAEHLLVVNTTPLGMSPKVEAMPALPYEALTAEHLCYDLVYNPLETRFLAESRKRGAQTQNGWEMLHRQALAAWEMWNEER